MAEWLVAGAAGVSALYLLKKPYYGGDEGVLDDTIKSIPTEGVTRPQGYIGDLNSMNTLTAQSDMESSDKYSTRRTKMEFLQYFNTEKGQADFVAWQKNNGKKSMGVKGAHRQMLAFEHYWRGRVSGNHIKDVATNIHKRTVMQSNVVGTNAWDPDRFTTVRNRSGAIPLIAEFHTSKTQFTGSPTWLDNSPFTLINYTGIEETPYAADRFGLRSDRDTHLDITPTIATAAPTSTASQKVGSVRVRIPDLKKTTRQVGIKVKPSIRMDPHDQLHHAVEDAQNYKKIIVR